MSSTKRFSFDTVQDFERHIRSSIPRYDDCLKASAAVAGYFVQEGTNVYDVGCSTGRFLRALKVPAGVRKIGMDKSLHLLPASKPGHSFLAVDLNEDFVFNNASLVASLFTLQFLRLAERARILKRIYEGLNQGGGLILAEKVFAADSRIQDVMTFLYYDFKRGHFTEEQILAKERDLRRMMWPLSHEENLELLRAAGFRKADVFFRHFNFEAILCVK